MLCPKEKCFQPWLACLVQFVPENNFCRHL